MRECVWLVWPCQMAWWTAWIQTAVCRRPVTPPLCVWAPRTPWTSSRRHRCPLHRTTCRLSMTVCASWWVETAPTSSQEPTPSMASEWLVHYSHQTPPSATFCSQTKAIILLGRDFWHQYQIEFSFFSRIVICLSCINFLWVCTYAIESVKVVIAGFNVSLFDSATQDSLLWLYTQMCNSALFHWI